MPGLVPGPQPQPDMRLRGGTPVSLAEEMLSSLWGPGELERGSSRSSAKEELQLGDQFRRPGAGPTPYQSQSPGPVPPLSIHEASALCEP